MIPTELAVPLTSNEILQYVTESKLDEIPEAINLRQTLLEIYGIKQQDNDKALKKYFIMKLMLNPILNKLFHNG